MAFVAPETGMGVRRQLTLFLAGEMAAAVEAVRRVVDPEQYRLIPAHVTLCPEEEIAGIPIEELEARIPAGPARGITQVSAFQPLAVKCSRLLENIASSSPPMTSAGIFGRPRIGGRQARAIISVIARPRPHVTLAHPRNPRAPGNSLEAALALPPRWQARLAWIHLIAQEGAQPWRRLAMFDLSV